MYVLSDRGEADIIPDEESDDVPELCGLNSVICDDVGNIIVIDATDKFKIFDKCGKYIGSVEVMLA